MEVQLTDAGTTNESSLLPFDHEDTAERIDVDRVITAGVYEELRRVGGPDSGVWDYGGHGVIGRRKSKPTERLVPQMGGRTYGNTREATLDNAAGNKRRGEIKEKMKKRRNTKMRTLGQGVSNATQQDADAPCDDADIPDGDDTSVRLTTEEGDDVCAHGSDKCTKVVRVQKKNIRGTPVRAAGMDMTVSAAVAEALQIERARELSRQKTELAKERRTVEEMKVAAARKEGELQFREETHAKQQEEYNRLCANLAEDRVSFDQEKKTSRAQADVDVNRIKYKAMTENAKVSETGEVVCPLCRAACGGYAEKTRYEIIPPREKDPVELKARCVVCYDVYPLSGFYALTCTHAICAKCTKVVQLKQQERADRLEAAHAAVDARDAHGQAAHAATTARRISNGQAPLI